MKRAERIYLDVCCINRPTDDLSVTRNRLEAEAVLAIVEQALQGEWTIVSSGAIQYEIGKCVNKVRQEAAAKLVSAARVSLAVRNREYERASELAGLGFGSLDALHIACAESAQCAVLLSTDDRLLRRALRRATSLRVRVENPLQWLLEQSDENATDDAI